MFVLDTGNLVAANSSPTKTSYGATPSTTTTSPPANPGLYHSWQTVALAKKVGFEGDCEQHVPDLASTDIVESWNLTWLWQCLDFISGRCFFCVFAHCLVMHMHLAADSGLRVAVPRALLNKDIRPLCLLSCFSLSARARCAICFLLLTSMTAPLPRIGADPEIQKPKCKLGMVLTRHCGSPSAVTVHNVIEGSCAAEAHPKIHDGDTLLAVNGKEVSLSLKMNLEDVKTMMQRASPQGF